MKEPKARSNGRSEEFDNFDRLFRNIISVPKAAVEEQEEIERAKNQQKREGQKAAKKKATS